MLRLRRIRTSPPTRRRRSARAAKRRAFFRARRRIRNLRLGIGIQRTDTCGMPRRPGTSGTPGMRSLRSETRGRRRKSPRRKKPARGWTSSPMPDRHAPRRPSTRAFATSIPRRRLMRRRAWVSTRARSRSTPSTPLRHPARLCLRTPATPTMRCRRGAAGASCPATGRRARTSPRFPNARARAEARRLPTPTPRGRTSRTPRRR
mmetsp:Transcript_13795/g.58001  ORF Transcript_13795/g.58001 Transcript_13795/m.58001 type:complete len:205 (-) Transcript_13795:76-690(-)